MHHNKVVVFERPKGEDGDGIKTIHIGVNMTKFDVSEKDMPGRRNSVFIQFECYSCGSSAELRIDQHKGETHVEWLTGSYAHVTLK